MVLARRGPLIALKSQRIYCFFPVVAVAAVCPTIELDLCTRAIERRINWGYQWNFMRGLKARLRRMAEAWPGAFDLAPLVGLPGGAASPPKPSQTGTLFPDIPFEVEKLRAMTMDVRSSRSRPLRAWIMRPRRQLHSKAEWMTDETRNAQRNREKRMRHSLAAV